MQFHILVQAHLQDRPVQIQVIFQEIGVERVLQVAQQHIHGIPIKQQQ